MSTHVKSAVTELATLDHGRRPIGTTAGRIVAVDSNNRFGIRLIADPANTEPVYIGLADVTPGTVEATDGYPLLPGRELSLPLGTCRELWGVAPTQTQQVFALWM